MRIHDISMPLKNGMPTWPGDEPFNFRLSWSQASSASVNVGHMQMSVHVGTHADSPFHVDSTGIAMEALPLDIFIGPAAVLDLSHVPVTRDIEIDDLEAAARSLGETSFASLVAGVPRVLFKTMTWSDRRSFPADFLTLSESAAEFIAHSGAKLIGVDVPSVDREASKTLPVHQRLIGRQRVGAGVQILENLVLDDVRPGVYELIALPLSIVGGDGSPVRAVLVAR